MDLVNMHDAKTHFSALIRGVLRGEDIVIAKAGKPLVRLVPYIEEPTVRQGGQLKGMIQISEDFDAPLSNEQLRLFYGEGDKAS